MIMGHGETTLGPLDVYEDMCLMAGYEGPPLTKCLDTERKWLSDRHRGEWYKKGEG